MMDTTEARLAKDRVRNATAALRQQTPAFASIGMQGATVYALLDVANAIRERGPDDKTKRLLSISDALVGAIIDGAKPEQIKQIAETFEMIRKDFEVDQMAGLPRLKGME